MGKTGYPYDQKMENRLHVMRMRTCLLALMATRTSHTLSRIKECWMWKRVKPHHLPRALPLEPVDPVLLPSISQIITQSTNLEQPIIPPCLLPLILPSLTENSNLQSMRNQNLPTYPKKRTKIKFHPDLQSLPSSSDFKHRVLFSVLRPITFVIRSW